MTRPGARLRTIAARVCSAKAIDQLIDPVIADLQAEYAQAVRLGQTWRSRWVRIAGYVAFVKVMVFHGGGRFLHDWTPADHRALVRTIGFSVAAIAAATLLLIVPPLRQQTSSHASYVHASQARLALYLMPQALPLAVPLGFMLGVLCGYGRCLLSSRSRAAVLLIAITCSAGSFVSLAWITPAANQAFRVAVFGRDVVKGAPELTLGELGQLLDSGGHEPMALAPARDRRSLAWQYHFRYALSCAPLALAWFALSVIGRHQRGPVVLVICACAAVCGYYVCIWGARRLMLDGTWPVVATVWFPNVACGVVSTALMAVDSQRSDVASGT
jgi:hypothetical protein